MRSLLWRYVRVRRDGTFDGGICSGGRGWDTGVPCDVEEDLEAGGDGQGLGGRIG